MPIIHSINQGEEKWHALRAGKVTASELHNLITPLWKAREGEGVKTYLATKLAEKWIGGALPGFTTWATDQGEMREGEALKWFELEYDCEIAKVGFVEHDSGRFGGSPDGLIGEDGGIEIKSPEPVNHVRYLLDGTVPKDYLAQVHGSLYATGRPWWIFLSYRRGFPNLVVKVKRDEEIIEKIHDVVTDFTSKLNEAFERLKKMP